MKLNHHTRLSIIVIVTAAILMEVNNIVDFITTRRSFNEQLTEKAQHDLNESHRVDKLQNEVEATMAATLPHIKKMVDEMNIDSIRLQLRQLTLSERHIIGVAIGFEPGIVEQGVKSSKPLETTKSERGKLYCLYIYDSRHEIDDDDNIEIVEKSLDVDYTQRPWYKRGINSKGYWSEPYMGAYSNVLMCSYSQPIYDASGKKVAVLAADVPLHELSQMATQFYDNQRRVAAHKAVLHVLGLLLLGFIVVRAVSHLRRLQMVNAEKERIAGELSVAHDIQLSMIPKDFPGSPERDDVELYASLTPALEVGGDFYDFLIRNGRLYFCIGDVSGKGVPAALLMAMTRSLFRIEAKKETSSSAIVTRMNELICEEQTSGYFVTMFVGVLNLSTGHLNYCNAGHEKPILGDESLPVKPNIPIGAIENWKFEAQTAEIPAGVTLFLYTDGVSEACNTQLQFFSHKRIFEVIHRTPDLSPKELVEMMVDEIKHYSGDAEQSDDITLMAIRWKESTK